MALSPKQLRLVFARLRAKGLLDYMKKGQREFPSTIRSARPLKLSEIKMNVPRLIDRLPASHQKMMHIEGGVKMHSTINSFRKVVKSEWAAGVYDSRTQRIHLHKSSKLHSTGGYSSRPALDLARTRVRYKEISTRAGTSVLLGHPTARRWKMVESATVLYHEIGHSINYKGLFSRSRQWTVALRTEWTDVKPHEYTEATSLWGKLPIHTVPAKEAWADAYAMYARSKSSRNVMRKERPLTYEYMKKFFEEAKR